MDQILPISFGNDAEAVQAASQGVALVDRHHWGRLSVTGQDRLTFLHNQSTNDVKRLQPGQGCDTVFVTSTARTLDLASIYVTEDSVLVLVAPNRRQKLLPWLDRFIFFGDQVEVTDITDRTVSFSLIGPASEPLLAQFNIQGEMAPGNHHLAEFKGLEVRVARGNGLTPQGYTLFANTEDAAVLWQTLVEAGAVPLGERCWEQLRVQQGRPKPDHELTEDYNPLEAGLWRLVSFNKGCYIGQETIARLNTYQGVKQQLWGVRLNAPAAPGTPINLGDSRIGLLTSYTDSDQGPLGLAYIRTKAGGQGLRVEVGESEGELIDLPFLSREPQQP